MKILAISNTFSTVSSLGYLFFDNKILVLYQILFTSKALLDLETTEYTKLDFTLKDQIRVKELCDKIDHIGAKFILNNSLKYIKHDNIN